MWHRRDRGLSHSLGSVLPVLSPWKPPQRVDGLSGEAVAVSICRLLAVSWHHRAPGTHAGVHSLAAGKPRGQRAEPVEQPMA